MKKLLLAFAATALFAACSPIYYQVYQTKPITEGAAIDKEAIVFANKDCRVTYNFYSNGGDAGFLLTNLTDSIMYVHMDESFFVLNGVTNDYYRQSFDIQGQSRTIGSSLNISLNNEVESKKKKNREVEKIKRKKRREFIQSKIKEERKERYKQKQREKGGYND